jgi:hypothetical protein
MFAAARMLPVTRHKQPASYHSQTRAPDDWIIIVSCEYMYNLSANALGVGTYRVDIKINGQVVGSAVFGLK